jgi:hypothetical protein
MVGGPEGGGRGVVIDADPGAPAAGTGRRRAAQLPQNLDVSGLSDRQ